MEGLEIGALVDYHSEIGGPVTKENCRIRPGPWQLGSGQWVIKIGGMAGKYPAKDDHIAYVCQSSEQPHRTDHLCSQFDLSRHCG